jgi:hypothetical protein
MPYNLDSGEEDLEVLENEKYVRSNTFWYKNLTVTTLIDNTIIFTHKHPDLNLKCGLYQYSTLFVLTEREYRNLLSYIVQTDSPVNIRKMMRMHKLGLDLEDWISLTKWRLGEDCFLLTNKNPFLIVKKHIDFIKMLYCCLPVEFLEEEFHEKLGGFLNPKLWFESASDICEEIDTVKFEHQLDKWIKFLE